MELKSRTATLVKTGKLSINRTIMELKFNKKRAGNRSVSSINRTIMELK